MTSARISQITTAPFETPLHHPFVTSQGSATMGHSIAVTLTLEDGRTARGESTPVAYVTGETLETVQETVRQVAPELIGQEAHRYRLLLDSIGRLAPHAPSARCGLEMAVLDAWTQVSGTSLAQLWGASANSVESDITIPIVPNVAELAELAWGLGIRVFKIKVGGGSMEEDYARVAAIRQAAPDAHLRIDANQAFTVDGALAFVERLVSEGARIELLEQPVPKEDFAGLGAVAARCAVPVFADESVQTPADALRLATTTAIHGFNCKINKCGIQGVLDIIAIARASGRRLMLGCMLETRRSIAVSLALACGTGAFEVIDLDSHLLLDEPGENPHFHQEGPRLLLPSIIE